MARGGWTGFLSLRDNGAATSLGTLGGAFKSVTDNFKKGFLQNFNLFTLMKKGIDEVVKSAKELIKDSREIVTTSVKFNIPIAQLGELRYVAVQSGLGVNGLSAALGGLRDSLLEGVINPGGEATWALKKLGIGQADLLDLTDRTSEVFWGSVDALRAMNNETDRDILLKAIYKDKWQEVRIIVKKSAEEIQKMKDESHKYTDEATKSNENVSKSWDRIGERLKTLGSALTPIMGLLAGLVEFVVSSVIVAFHALGFVLERIGTIGTRIFQGLGTEAVALGGKAANAVRAMTPGNGYTSEMRDADNAKIDKDREASHAESNKEYREKTDANLAQSWTAIKVAAKGISSGWDTMYDSAEQLNINAGFQKNRLDKANDDEIKEGREITSIRDKQATDRLRLAEAEAKKEKMRADGADETTLLHFENRTVSPLRDNVNGAEEKIQEIFKKQRERFNKLKEFYPDAVREDGVIKAKTSRKVAEPTIETFKQTEIRLEQEKAVREQTVKRIEANTDVWDKWKQAVVIAQMQYANAQDDYRKFIISGDAEDIKKKNAFLNAQTNAHINLQAKQKELQNLKDIAARDDALADIDRKNKAIEGQQGRDLFGMKMRGVSAIDQQNVVFRNSVDKMKREEAKLEALKNDKTREKEYMEGHGPAAIALNNSIQDLMMAAAGEMDTLMAMQFNYVSSDAAKKGMGGGIAMVNNPLDVAKESRDYLRKIYESMNGTGSFDVVPKYMKGTQGWFEGDTVLRGNNSIKQ